MGRQAVDAALVKQLPSKGKQPARAARPAPVRTDGLLLARFEAACGCTLRTQYVLCTVHAQPAHAVLQTQPQS